MITLSFWTKKHALLVLTKVFSSYVDESRHYDHSFFIAFVTPQTQHPDRKCDSRTLSRESLKEYARPNNKQVHKNILRLIKFQ